jgi:hypothetical protein
MSRMSGKNIVENSGKPSTSTTSSLALELRLDYQNLVQKARDLFPKVDQTLLMDMLKLETKQKDWQGTVILEIRYSKNQAKLIR